MPIYPLPRVGRPQVEGAFVQGMGWSCIEELVWGDSQHTWVRPGQLFTRGPGTYKVRAAAGTAGAGDGAEFLVGGLAAGDQAPGVAALPVLLPHPPPPPHLFLHQRPRRTNPHLPVPPAICLLAGAIRHLPSCHVPPAIIHLPCAPCPSSIIHPHPPPTPTTQIPTANDIPIDFRVALLRNAPCERTPMVHSSKAVGEPPFFLGERHATRWRVCACLV